jgi:hypothetical protein
VKDAQCKKVTALSTYGSTNAQRLCFRVWFLVHKILCVRNLESAMYEIDSVQRSGKTVHQNVQHREMVTQEICGRQCCGTKKTIPQQKRLALQTIYGAGVGSAEDGGVNPPPPLA